MRSPSRNRWYCTWCSRWFGFTDAGRCPRCGGPLDDREPPAAPAPGKIPGVSNVQEA